MQMCIRDSPTLENHPLLRNHNKEKPDCLLIRLGTWNVLSLYKHGVLQQLLNQLDKYKVDVAAVQEIRWTRVGMFNRRSHTVYQSCDERLYNFGTGFLVSKRMSQMVISFKLSNPWICYLRLRGKFYNYSLLSIHAPIETSEEMEKDRFVPTVGKYSIHNKSNGNGQRLINFAAYKGCLLYTSRCV